MEKIIISWTRKNSFLEVGNQERVWKVLDCLPNIKKNKGG